MVILKLQLNEPLHFYIVYQRRVSKPEYPGKTPDNQHTNCDCVLEVKIYHRNGGWDPRPVTLVMSSLGQGPEGGWALLMSPPCLEPQACHLIPGSFSKTVPLEWFPWYECNQRLIWHLMIYHATLNLLLRFKCSMWWTDICTIDWSGIVNIQIMIWINKCRCASSITRVTWKPKRDMKFASFVELYIIWIIKADNCFFLSC